MRGWLRKWWRRRRRAAPVERPDDVTIRSQQVWITAQVTGLVIRRRFGRTNWMPVCQLPWDEIEAMELDTGTHDATRMLYASLRSSPMRKPLFDQRHLSAEQWRLLRDSVSQWTGQGVWINLAHLGVADRSRPYDEL